MKNKTAVLLPLLAVPFGSAALAEIYEGRLNADADTRIILPAGSKPYLNGILHIDAANPAADGISLFLDTPQPAGRRPLLQGRTATDSFELMLPAGVHTLHLHSSGTAARYRLELRREGIRGYQRHRPSENTPASPVLQKLQHDLQQQPDRKQALEQRFWQHIRRQGGTPLIEPSGNGSSRVTFLWRGAEHNVRLIGAPSYDHEWLQRLPGSGVWYKSFNVPDTLRLSYSFAPDVPALAPDSDVQKDFVKQRRALLGVIRPDPLNPKTFAGESLLELPAAPVQTGIPAAAPQNRMQAYTFYSRILGNSRRIRIYRTAHVSAVRPLQIYLLDGYEYTGKVPTPAIFDALARRLNIPVAAIFIDNADHQSRSRELPPNPAFADMLAVELQPFVAANTGLSRMPERTVIAGSSYGGLAAAYAALRHPETFGSVLSMSGSFWWKGGAGSPFSNGLPAYIRKHGSPDVRWFVSAGIYEKTRGGEAGIYETSRELSKVLSAQRREVYFREYTGGHDYAVWQGALGDGLEALYGGQKLPCR